MRQPEELRKWAYLLAAPHADVRSPELRRRARALAIAAGDRPHIYVALAAALARDGIRFVRDRDRTGAEDIAGYTREPGPSDAVDALVRGEDDCDAKARLFVALCLAMGIRARMAPIWTDDGRLQHVYAEVRLDGAWQPVELTLARARVGDDPFGVPFEKGTTSWKR